VARPTRDVHPSEIESYRTLRSRLDTGRLPPFTRAVVERVVHTTADPTWMGEVMTEESTLAAGRNALLAGAPVIVDVRMVAAAVTDRACVVGLDLPGVADLAAEDGLTRPAAGIRLAARRYPEGAVWVVGNEPTALNELTDLVVTGALRPALVVGMPVGFVVSNAGERGGAAVAAAIVNALLYFDEDEYV
jgi:precorrin-8X/cobalt-precorrin-8 methylmutase